MSEQIVVDETPTEEAIEVEPTAEPIEGESDLGDAGKKALDAMKSQRNAATKEAKEARAELEKFRTDAALKDKPAEEQALETARAEARAEATKSANTRILKSELKAAATGKLADPTDAALYINLDDFDVNDDGDVDTDALTEAIDALLSRKPHLAAGGARKFEGAADQGAKGKAPKATQVTQAELDGMSLAQINAARTAGRLATLMGNKP
jgi:hypothetical protein